MIEGIVVDVALHGRYLQLSLERTDGTDGSGDHFILVHLAPAVEVGSEIELEKTGGTVTKLVVVKN